MIVVAETIKKVYLDKGYTFYDAGKKFNLNIFGIRNETPINTFSESLCVLYRNEFLRWQFYQWPATTRPGAKALRMPKNVKGTGILVPSQYKDCYCIDKHKGQYDALCQRLGPVKVVRDPNRDEEIDMDMDRVESGIFGVNLHKALSDTVTVDEWSYLCQVFKRDGDFNRFMAIAKVAAGLWGNKFTYTLFEEADFTPKVS